MHDSVKPVKFSETTKPKTVLEAFLQNLEVAPVHLLAGLHGEAQTVSRREIYVRGCALAHKFQALGIKAGDKVMTILPTGKPFLVSVFGAWCAGAARAIGTDDAACVAAQLCDTSARARGRSSLDPGVAGARQPVFDPDLHRGRRGAPDGRVPKRAPARLKN